MISVDFHFDNRAKIDAGEPSRFSVSGAMKATSDIDAVVTATIARIKATADDLGGDCRSNAHITKEDDGTISVMINVAQIKS